MALMSSRRNIHSTNTRWVAVLICLVLQLTASSAGTTTTTKTSPTTPSEDDGSIKLSELCTIPPYYEWITLGEELPALLFNVTITGSDGDKRYRGGQMLSVTVLQAPETNIIDFISWFEVEAGAQAGTRVGAWDCCNTDAPRTMITDCGGEASSTLTNERPIGDPDTHDDFKLLWRAPAAGTGTLLFTITLVTQEASGSRHAYVITLTIQETVPAPPSLSSTSSSSENEVENETENENEDENESESNTNTNTNTNPNATPANVPSSGPSTTAPSNRGPPGFVAGPIGSCNSSSMGFPPSPRVLPLWVNEDGTERLFQTPPDAIPEPLDTPCDKDGRCWQFFSIDIDFNDVQIFADGPATRLFSYGQNGHFTTPGPTIKTCSAQQVIVRHHNHIKNADGTNRRISVHLHGSASFAPYDGWADDTTETSQFKDYVYPTNRPATLWYHDHAFSITSDNALRGLYGQFWVRNCCRNYTGILPDEQFDLPLFLVDAVFDQNNQIRYDKQGVHEDIYYGDHNFINGVAWPVMHVQPRVYRYRNLVSAISRPFDYSFRVESTGQILPFFIVGTDGGLLGHPVQVNHLIHAVSERYETVMDFRGYEGEVIYMTNAQFSDGAMFCQSHLLMKIVVDRPLDTSIPEVAWRTAAEFLNTPLLPEGKKALEDIVPDVYRNTAAAFSWGTYDRRIEFVRSNGEWKIRTDPDIDQIARVKDLSGNRALSWGETFLLPQPHITADPETNRVEVWEIVNGGGGWFHPIHFHLIDAIIVARKRTAVFPGEVDAAKDVFFLPPGDAVRIVARFGPVSGSFMFHCHNLVHEDNDMLMAFGTQMDHSVVRKLSPGLFKAENTFIIPTTPVNSINQFATTLRNPMLDSERSKVEPPLLNATLRIQREQDSPIYTVFYPSPNDPTRAIDPATGEPFPIGSNPTNPYEFDYTCLFRPPEPLSV